MAPRGLTRAIILGLAVVSLLTWLHGRNVKSTLFVPIPGIQDADRASRTKQIEDAFQHAWDGYSKYCFGRDSLHPVSNRCDDDFGGWGASAIDALSTAIIMGKEDVVLQILKYIASLDFATVRQGKQIQTFEVTIRHLGGMISAHDLLIDGPFSSMATDEQLRRRLFDQMINLGDALSCSFDKDSGIPHDWVNPETCETSNPGTTNTLAGIGSMILEFARLSDIAGVLTYKTLAEDAEAYLLTPKPVKNSPFPGLLGSYVSIGLGELTSSIGSWGALCDSFYEYLLKAYMYDAVKYSSYLERWITAADSTIRHIGSHPYGHPEWSLLPSWSGTSLKNQMDSLSWFAGGNFILGGMILNNQTFLDFGISIADTAGAIYSMTQTGLGGEQVSWTTDCGSEWAVDCNATNSVRIVDGSFKLRPEVLETWYYAFRATKDQKYREWSWAAFEAIEKHCKTGSGYSAIADVDAADGGKKLDMQESFVYAEVLKYIYLTHADDALPYHVHDSRTGRTNAWVLNTEAHFSRSKGSLSEPGLRSEHRLRLYRLR